MNTVETRVNTDGSVDKNPLNRDPISGTPGAHPVGTGVGAAGGAAAGAALGSAVAGPVGTVVGAVVGAVGGGLAGKAAGEAMNPTLETVETTSPVGDTSLQTSYWRNQYSKEPYYQSGQSFEDYEPAYRTGISGYQRHAGKPYDQVVAELENDYNLNQGHSNLTWDRAEAATRAAWHRLERALPGDADGDGR